MSNLTLQNNLNQFKNLILNLLWKLPNPDTGEYESVYHEKNIFFGSINNEQIPIQSNFIYIEILENLYYDISSKIAYLIPENVVDENNNFYTRQRVECVRRFGIRIGSQTDANISTEFANILFGKLKDPMYIKPLFGDFTPYGIKLPLQHAEFFYDRNQLIPVSLVECSLRFTINNVKRKTKYGYNGIELYQVNKTI